MPLPLPRGPLISYRSACEAFCAWHKLWRRTRSERHLETALACLAIARERHDMLRVRYEIAAIRTERQRRP